MQNKLMHYTMRDTLFDDNEFSVSRTISVQIIDMQNDAIAQECINVAKKEGVNDLFLMDKQFVLDALLEKIKAERMGKTKGGITGNEYQKHALRTAGTMNKMDMLINGVMGLSGEAGECIDLVKKTLFQEHELDRKRLAKELGDVAWYLAVTAEAINCTLDEIFQMNIDKLKERYPDGFDPERSRRRKADDV